MAEALTYLATLALFSFVLVGAALIRHDMLILVCIPPVFVALITGFIMAIYAQDTFGLLPVGAALLAARAAGLVAEPAVFRPRPADRDLPCLGERHGAGADRLQLSRPGVIAATGRKRRRCAGPAEQRGVRSRGRAHSSTTTYCSSTVTGIVSAT